MLDGFFGGDVTLAVGLVDGDFWVVDFVGDEKADGAFGHLAEEIEDGELERGEGNEHGHAGGLVVRLVDHDHFEEEFEIAGVFAKEEGSDAVYEDGVKRLHLLGVGDGDAFGTVFGADEAEPGLFVVEELDGVDDDGRREELALEDGERCGGIAFGEVGG